MFEQIDKVFENKGGDYEAYQRECEDHEQAKKEVEQRNKDALREGISQVKELRQSEIGEALGKLFTGTRARLGSFSTNERLYTHDYGEWCTRNQHNPLRAMQVGGAETSFDGFFYYYEDDISQPPEHTIERVMVGRLLQYRQEHPKKQKRFIDRRYVAALVSGSEFNDELYYWHGELPSANRKVATAFHELKGESMYSATHSLLYDENNRQSLHNITPEDLTKVHSVEQVIEDIEKNLAHFVEAYYQRPTA